MFIESDRRASFVLITGLGRSGSTIVQRALTMHPAIFIADEAWYVYNVASVIAARRPREFMGLDQRQMGQWLASTLIIGHQLAGGGKQWVGDKCPPAIRYLEVITQMFADAGIDLHLIFTIRHPFDCALSWYERFGSKSLAALRPYTSLRSSDAGFDEVMGQVLKVWASAARTMAAASATSAQVVQYEKLVTAPSTVLASLCTTLGVAPEPWILQKAFNGPVIGGDPKFARTTKIHTASVGRHLTCHADQRAALDRAFERLGTELAEPAKYYQYSLVSTAESTSVD